jgi:iron complex transport system substrate-binding protein
VRQKTLNPSSRIVCLSSVIVAYLEELGLSHTVLAVDDAKYISSVSLSKRITSGDLKSVKPGAQLDVEKVLALRPDAVLYYEGGNGEDASMNLLRKRGVRLIPLNSYQESHPLGRAEWLRFTGRLFGMEQKADSLFNDLAFAYQQEKEGANRKGENRPTVFCNAPFGGVWDQPEGSNYMATLIADAGGNYLWAESPGNGTLHLQPEAVLKQAITADVWLNCNDYTERKQLLVDDQRLASFTAFRNGNVYAANGRKSNGSANPFWELGVVRPDLVLKDLVQIFHDSTMLAPLFFYRKLP